ncbi:MAG: hypothetical protein NDP13_01280 [Crenarchaeota archaeon]|nr:hypothetical protein [Thermoproteota archaeon]
MSVIDESTLSELHDEASSTIARVLHYLIFHAKNVQLYHELRLSVGNDVGKFSELLSYAQRELYKLKDDEEHGPYVRNIRWPSENDMMVVQKHHAKFGKAYLQVLLGMVSGACKKCREEQKGGRLEEKKEE